MIKEYVKELVTSPYIKGTNEFRAIYELNKHIELSQKDICTLGRSKCPRGFEYHQPNVSRALKNISKYITESREVNGNTLISIKNAVLSKPISQYEYDIVGKIIYTPAIGGNSNLIRILYILLYFDKGANINDIITTFGMSEDATKVAITSLWNYQIINMSERDGEPKTFSINLDWEWKNIIF